MASKNIKFYELRESYIENPNHRPPALNIMEVFDYINAIQPIGNRHFDTSQNKFCRLENVQAERVQIYKLLFKSATHKYRAPLLDSISGSERDNPKTMTEGERIKTHCIVKITRNNEVIFCLESGTSTLSIQNITNYLNHFIVQYFDSNNIDNRYRIDFDIIAKDNFLEELQALNRVVSTEVFIDKQILGSDALNFSNRIQTVQEDIKFTVKAQRGQSISNTVIDLYNKLNGGRSTIHKIRVQGRNEMNNNVVLDTELISKIESVEVETNIDTGEVNSETIFEQLMDIGRNL